MLNKFLGHQFGEFDVLRMQVLSGVLRETLPYSLYNTISFSEGKFNHPRLRNLEFEKTPAGALISSGLIPLDVPAKPLEHYLNLLSEFRLSEDRTITKVPAFMLWEGVLFKPSLGLKLLKTLPYFDVSDPEYLYYISAVNRDGSLRISKTKFHRFLKRELGIETRNYDMQLSLLTGQVGKLVKFIPNDDVDSWEEAYRSPNIRSCMNNTDYGVTQFDTYRCYCTSAYGLPHNGLELAVLNSPGYPEPTARAIVHQPSKTYIRVYGDDRLSTMLRALGYSCVDEFSIGLILYAPEEMGGNVHPYVDGRNTYAQLKYAEDNTPYWELCSYSNNYDYDLASTTGVAGDSIATCPNCGEIVREDTLSEVVLNGEEQYLCSCCREDAIEVLDEGSWVWTLDETVCAADSNGNYQDYLDTYDNRRYYNIEYSQSEGEYLVEPVYSEYEEDYFKSCDVTFLGYMDDYAQSCNVVEIEGVWVHNDDTEWVSTDHGSVLVPVEGLSDELDGIREDLLNENEGQENE